MSPKGEVWFKPKPSKSGSADHSIFILIPHKFFLYKVGDTDALRFDIYPTKIIELARNRRAPILPENLKRISDPEQELVVQFNQHGCEMIYIHNNVLYQQVDFTHAVHAGETWRIWARRIQLESDTIEWINEMISLILFKGVLCKGVFNTI